MGEAKSQGFFELFKAFWGFLRRGSFWDPSGRSSPPPPGLMYGKGAWWSIFVAIGGALPAFGGIWQGQSWTQQKGS